MKRAIASLLTITMLATSVPALADPPKVTASSSEAAPAPLPKPIIIPLNKGQSAPITGVLFSPPAVASVISQYDLAIASAALAVQHQAQIDAANQKYALDSQKSTCDADKKVLTAQITDLQKQNNILQDQLKKETGGPGAAVWIGLGAVGGIIVTILTTFAVAKATGH